MDVDAHFEVQRDFFRRYTQVLLEAAEPITAESVGTVELLLMEAEIDAARGALQALGPPAFDPGSPHFARQEGTTCMSTSIANGMISLGEPFLAASPERRVPLLTSDIVQRTSAFGKPGEYRSVDDMFKYLEAGKLGEVLDGEETFSTEYTVRLTCSLIDVCQALWTGRGRLVIQRSAHAHLAFGLVVHDGVWSACWRDPMTRAGSGYTKMSLEELRQYYLWSPLKKIPRLMGPHGFPQLSAEELLGHLDRYDTMENLGVDCPSALLFRRDEAPPLFSPPEDPDSEAAG